MGQTLMTLIKLAVFLPLVLALILWLGKVAEKYSTIGGRSNSMKIIDRLSLSKDNALLVVKLGEKFYFVTSSQGRVDIVRELDDMEIEPYKLSELSKIIEDKNNVRSLNKTFHNIIKIFKVKE